MHIFEGQIPYLRGCFLSIGKSVSVHGMNQGACLSQALGSKITFEFIICIFCSVRPGVGVQLYLFLLHIII